MGSNLPSPDDTNVFLGDAINIATRSVHTRLNKLILLRLPLAIPPRADGPAAYTQGILHIAPLYISFESLWHAALHSPDLSQDHPPSRSSTPTLHSSSPRPFPFGAGTTESSSHGPKPSPRIHSILDQLFIPGLLRSSRLRSDLRALTGWSDSDLQSHLESAATAGRLGAVVAHIRRSAERRPHTLLAYAWVLYMALFSGGRFIRATLESAGAHGFWSQPSPAHGQKRAVPAHGPLDFFHFPTPLDGEDLKHEFKQRLVDLSPLLTGSEREDIVKEAVCIFENLILVISQLDDVCHTKMADLDSDAPSAMSPRSAGFRIRDSVIVTKERSYRAAQRSQPVEASGTDTKGSESVSSTESEDEVENVVGRPGLPDKHVSSHTVQLASDSPKAEKEDPFSRRGSGRTRSDSSNMDPDLAERLSRAMRFDAALPVPDRTTDATGSTEEGLGNDGAVGGEKDTNSKGGDDGEGQPRQRSDSTFARGVQVASALGVAVALAVAYSRG